MMKIKYLGTAAAEGIPAVFCACETCQKAWAAGGRNVRTRSQALIGEDLFIDMPADTYFHSIKFGIDLTDIHHCLITHVHADHCYLNELCYLRKGFSHPPEGWEGINIYGSPDVEQEFNQVVQGKGKEWLQFVGMAPFEPAQVGRYTVTALKAWHGTANPYIYLITDGKSTLLYGHDTYIFPEETWDYLKATKPQLNLVSLDCTEGAKEDVLYRSHMCLGRNRWCRERLLEIGAADEKTKFVMNHFSHNGLSACYDDFAPIAEKEGFLTSYDGMELEF